MVKKTIKSRRRNKVIRRVSIRRDPVEYTAEYKKVEKEVDALAREIAKNHKGQLGYCHIFWGAKKRILKEKFGIEWRTPAETNPGIIID